MAKKAAACLITFVVLLIVLIVVDIGIYSSINKISHSMLTEINLVSSILLSPTRANIAIIGSSGYIGSRLLHHLRGQGKWNVIGYDRMFTGEASYEILTEDLQKFQVVVYLGGVTDRKLCEDHPDEAKTENVMDIYNLAKRMLPYQLLIFTSTSEIAKGYYLIPMNEMSPTQTHLFDAFVASMRDREIMLQELSLESTSSSAPQMIGLRLGDVIGFSRNQRIDFGHMAYVCQAFLGGMLRIVHSDAKRSFLGMEDLLRAVTVIIEHQRIAKQFDLFHLQSFSARISNMANTIALQSGARVSISNNLHNDSGHEFSLNTKKFRTTYRFVFTETQDEIISKLIGDVPRLCAGKLSSLDKNSVRCVVCGSHKMHTILDLHSQPLANDFKEERDEAMKCERFPLRLVRCPKCHHIQLSYIVDRNYISSHYLYQNDTSKSKETYHKWLAEKVISEGRRVNGTVLEIASNDGSQLTEFSKRGWNTVGIDSVKTLADLARAKGHTVYVGFWGVDKFPLLPSPKSLDAIVAQNVLAHVANPVQFLRACATIMSPKTKLYVQTPQCEMYETGQFDTINHEHISYFTAHSFKKLASLVGLHIVQFEITPNHGRSCLVTFQRIKLSSTISFPHLQSSATSFPVALQNERNLGLTNDWFYVKYRTRAQSMRQWIANQLTYLYAQGHIIIGYGASAKSMVLLHSLLEMTNQTWQFSYIIDDASLKQNTYCPGTSIPVRSSSELNKHDLSKPLTVVVFAWNFWEKISNKIRKKMFENGIINVFAIVPFPQQQLVKIYSNSTTIVTQNAFRLLLSPYPLPSMRSPAILFAHSISKEEFLSSWIRHHVPFFDIVLFIDYNITDKCLNIFQQEAPSNWKIISLRNQKASSQVIDERIKFYQTKYSKAWKIVLTTDEFLVHPNLRQMLAETERTTDIMALRFRSLTMVENKTTPLDNFTPLLNQRTQYILNLSTQERYNYRYIHRYPYAKHVKQQHSISESDSQWTPIGFIADYRLAFLSQRSNDKLSILTQTRFNDHATNEHAQHNYDTTQLKQLKENLKTMKFDDLRNIDASNEELKMAHSLWKEMTDH